jgi:hypothetical protein
MIAGDDPLGEGGEFRGRFPEGSDGRSRFVRQ